MITQNLSDIDSFFYRQLSEWDLAKKNYSALENVLTRELWLGKNLVQLQYNPARVQSSTAKVDDKSIRERACFLCAANRPTQQKIIHIDEKYDLLVNPYPIFPKHFTIPANVHTDQLIAGRFEDMLTLAKNMDNYVIFYNGPKAGASAPDHFHFQAGNKMFLPLEKNIETISKEIIYNTTTLTVSIFKDLLRNGFLIQGKDKEEIQAFFYLLYDSLEKRPEDKEPMMNILCWCKSEVWYCCVFPREKHRPDCYFADSDKNIMISPGCVDMGGVLITPLEKDFDKIQVKIIESIFMEVCIDKIKMQSVINKLKS